MEKVAKVSALKGALCLSVAGKKLALFKVGEKVFCLENACSHAGGPLCEGAVDGTVVTCPWHGSKFDVQSGKVKAGPAMKDVQRYKVMIKGDDIFVDV